MDRLSPLDSLFLHVEDGVTHMHIASCAIFEGPPPPYEDVVELIASKLPLLPRYRQRVRFPPANLGPPVWVDDPHFDLAYHVRHSALPPPGGEEELNNLMGRLMAVELDRDHPLWEAWMIEGLTGGRWALISKVHHCMVDGVSGTDLMVQLLDESPRPAAPPPESWMPAPEPSAARLAFDGVVDALTHSRPPGAGGGCAGPPSSRVVCRAARASSTAPWRWAGGCGRHRRSPSRERSAPIAVGPPRVPTSTS